MLVPQHHATVHEKRVCVCGWANEGVCVCVCVYVGDY